MSEDSSEARIFRLFLVLASTTVLGLVAAAPLWLTPGLPNSDDSLTHIFNFFAFDRQIRSGDWFPLRFPDHGLAYGYAVPAYYPPLPYLLWETIRLAGAGYIVTFKLGFTLITILAGWTSFALGRALFGWRGGLATAFVYVLSPYVLANLHFRGALAEHLGLAIGPLLFLVIYQLVNQPGWGSYLAATVTVALLIVTHFLSTLLYFPFALLYALWMLAGAPSVRAKGFGLLVAAALGGAALTSFYWLPAAVEQSGLKAIDLAAALAAYLAELVAPAALLAPAPFLDYANPHNMPELGLPAWILLLLAAGALLVRWPRLPAHQRGQQVFWALAAILALFLASTLAAGGWRQIPAVTLLQFPFRWLGPAWLGLALFVGGAANMMPHLSNMRIPCAGLGILLLLWFGVAGLRNLPLEPAMLRSLGVAQVDEAHINLAGLRAFEYDQADNLRNECWVWAYEYVPRTSGLSACVAMRDMILAGPPVITDLPPVHAQLQASQLTPNRLVANVSSPNPWTLSLHAFWTPGWRAMIDNQPTVPQPLEPLGVVSVPVPAGEHTVQIEHAPTALRQITRGLSALVFLIWFALALRRRPKLAACVLAGLLLLLGGPALVASRASAAPPMQDTAVEFAGQVALQGYALAVGSEQVRLDLVWLARMEMEASYKVFVHLIDDTGRLWTQADSRPVQYASNTNRWPPGQVILDRHELALPPELPAGHYQVRVGLYDETNGQRLAVVDGQGEPVDDQILLAYVEIGR
ncbi:MAG: hypothetical protein DCC57_04845 [Chloroflexi bacterium]|nr:MAG: hypothetical protein DCC57_04845 [Chloroflexota bacterium]